MLKKVFIIALVTLLVLCMVTAVVFAQRDSSESAVETAKNSVVGVAGGFTFKNGKFTVPIGKKLSFGSCFGVGKPGRDASVFVTSKSSVCPVDGKGLALGRNEHVYLIPNGANIFDESTLIKCRVLWTGEDGSGVDIAVIKAEKPVKGVKTLSLQLNGTDVGDTVYAIGSDETEALLESDFPTTQYPDLFSGNLPGNKANDKKEVPVAEETSLWESASKTSFQGRITGASSIENTKVLLSSAKVSRLNVGGPLVDEDGNVIGVNSLMSGGAKGFTAISIRYAADALRELKLRYFDASGLLAKLYEYRWFLLTLTVTAATVIAILSQNELDFSIEWPQLKKWRYRNKPEMTVSLLNANGLAARPMFRRIDRTLSIGRAQGMDVVFPDSTLGVSRKHCRIDRCGDRAILTDLNSTFGTFLNGRRLEPEMAVVLNNGDIITLGSNSVAFGFSMSN